jgi:hypothetical protein
MPSTTTRVSVWDGRARLGTILFRGIVLNLPNRATQRPYDAAGERVPFSFELSPPDFIPDEIALDIADEVFLNHVQGITPEGYTWRVDWPRPGRTAAGLLPYPRRSLPPSASRKPSHRPQLVPTHRPCVLALSVRSESSFLRLLWQRLL